MRTDKTAGFEGWAPVKFFMGKGPDGEKIGREGFRNVVNGQEVRPENGWDGEPPYATGEIISFKVSNNYRENYDQIRWDK